MQNYAEIKNSVKVKSEIVDEQGAICTLLSFDDELEMLIVSYGDGIDMPLLPIQFKGLANATKTTEQTAEVTVVETEKVETVETPVDETVEENSVETTAKKTVKKEKAKTTTESTPKERKKWFGPTPPQMLKMLERLNTRKPTQQGEKPWGDITVGFMRSILSVGDGIRVLDSLCGSDEPFDANGHQLPVSTKQSRWAFNILTKDQDFSKDDANKIIATMTRETFQTLIASVKSEETAA